MIKGAKVGISESALEINGRFLAAEMTGVHRVATELVRELAGRTDELSHIFSGQVSVRAPKNAISSLLPNNLTVLRKSFLKGHAWEQVELPVRAGSSVLLNLSNLAPVISNKSITMIHDAQIYRTPESYSRAFVNFYRHVQPILGRRALRVLTVSKFSASELTRWHIAQAEKVHVIYNGVDHVARIPPVHSIFSRINVRRHRYVLALSNVQAHKNLQVLLEAFADPTLRDLRLVLFGSDGRAEMIAAGLTLPPNVVCTGRISDGELRALMEGAVCFAMPSRTEGFGLPPLEAMLLGCPALVSNAGALPEVCGDAALYASSLKPEEWRGAIRAFADHPELYAHYAARGRRQAARFTWQRAGDALISVLRDVAVELSAERTGT